MQSLVGISDIRRRQTVLESAEDNITSAKSLVIFNLYETAKKTDKHEDIRNFIRECGANSHNANEYLVPCIEFVARDNDLEFNAMFKNNILPKVGDFELRYNLENHGPVIQEMVSNQIVKNKVSDRIIDNHNSILKEYDVLSIFANKSNTMVDSIRETCSVIDRFDMPPYAKLNTSIEEVSYLLQRSGINYNPKEMTKTILEYFLLSNESLSSTDRKNFSKVLSENYMIEDYAELMHDFNSSSIILSVLDKYNKKSDHNSVELYTVTKNLFTAQPWDWEKNIDKYFDLLTQQVVYGPTDTKKAIAEHIIPTFYNDFERRMGGAAAQNPEIVSAIVKSMEKALQDSEKTYIYDNGYIELYKDSLTKELEKFKSLQGMMYTKENLEYMFVTPVTESSNKLTIYEFKEFKMDNLVTRCYKFDRFLQKEIRNWAAKVGQKIGNTLEKIHDKIYEESSIYEMLTPEGYIDFVVASFSYDPENVEHIHEMCTGLVKYYNENELKGSEYVSYYTLESDCISFHIRSLENILLTEDDRIITEEMISYEDLERISKVSLVAESLREDFDLFNEATEFFINNPDSGLFESFCEACNMAGIDKEIVSNIYEWTKDNCDPEFVAENSYYINTYENNENPNPEIALEAMIAIESLLEANQNTKNAKIDPKANNKPNGVRTKVTPTVAKSKVSKTTPTTKSTVNSKVSDVKAKVQGAEDKVKGLNINDFKLYVAGLKKHLKDADAKTKSAVRDMDFIAEKLLKSIKGALVSDRRESIIKGSVIPSFHKCILIAISLAGLAWFNVPLAIIAAVGGFAISKKLTERERALMLDDIEIELELVEKEIQMADNRNQIKKLRQLMKMKKTLQREYQRIKFNIRIGKDIIPSNSYLPEKQ